MNKSKWEVLAEGVCVTEGDLWLELLFDGNRLAEVPTALQQTEIQVSHGELSNGILSFEVVSNNDSALLCELQVIAGTTESRGTFDASTRVPGGVGRIARFDDYYHETNLAWIWHLSRFGELKATFHAGRRWLHSYHGGGGRVPVLLDAAVRKRLEGLLEETRVELESLRKQPLHPATLTRRARVKALEELLIDGESRRDLKIESVQFRYAPTGAAEQLVVYGLGLASVSGVFASIGEVGHEFSAKLLSCFGDDELFIDLTCLERPLRLEEQPVVKALEVFGSQGSCKVEFGAPASCPEGSPQ